jgi:glutaredoxin
MILYSQKTCAPCNDLKTYLDKKGIRYTVRDIDEDPEYLSLLLKHTEGRLLVPTLTKGSKTVVGLNWRAIAELIQ